MIRECSLGLLFAALNQISESLGWAGLLIAWEAFLSSDVIRHSPARKVTTAPVPRALSFILEPGTKEKRLCGTETHHSRASSVDDEMSVRVDVE